MRLVFSILRVAALCAFTVILWAKPAVTNAQYGGACFTYVLEEVDCADCCSLQNHMDIINTPSGPGVMTFVDATLACGTSASGCKFACGNAVVEVPAYNPTCTTCVQ
jgi:hypothetical protein